MNPRKQSERLKPIFQRLAHLAGLPDNWDSYGAQRVDSLRAELAVITLGEVMESDTPLPSIVPTKDGGIQIEWHCRGIDLQIEPVSPNRIEYYVCTPNGEEREGDWANDLTELRALIHLLGDS